MQLTFLGAAGSVTGSKTLVRTANGRHILVDCGLFQGPRRDRERNWEPPAFDLNALDAIVLTHAHIDHSGYLPALTRRGYKGPVYCSAGTADLLRILLPDSGYLQEEEARHANKWGWSRHRPAQPLYTRDDAVACLSLLRTVELDHNFEPAPGVSALLRRAGHIVGSSTIWLSDGDASVAFSGDVGRPHDPIMRPPAPILDADVLVIESTYGDREHPDVDALEQLEGVVNATLGRGGTLVVPAFAVGRSQHVLYLISTLRAAGRIPECPVYLDSPMAINATKIYCDHTSDHRLPDEHCRLLCDVAQYSVTPEQSKAIDRSSESMIVVSASGMLSGGRVLHHLKRFLPEKGNTVLMVGYQAKGTRGRRLLEGATELKIHGDMVPVRAEVAQIDALSAHADGPEIEAWLSASGLSPRKVFVNHGEPRAAAAMAARLEKRFGWDVELPVLGQRYDTNEAASRAS